MEDLLSQDDLNALLGGSSEKTITASKNKINDMEDLLSQDDLNALLGGSSEKTITASKNEINGMEDLLSQDDLNALLGGSSEKTITASKQMTMDDIPAEEPSAGGESMSQEEIDEMLRQFDRNI
jgi:flagellar motor switch protein FliM